MIFRGLENIKKEKRDNQKVVSLFFGSLNRSKTDFSLSGVSDVLMDETEERGSRIPVGATATQKNNNEQNHYYPFGLKHQKYSPAGSLDLKAQSADIARPGYVTSTDFLYRMNGKEWQDELGLNMYDMDMRQYDPAIARWVVLDPVIHHSMSPYNAFDNNPVFWADPSGADSIFDQQGTSYSSITTATGMSISAGGAGDNTQRPNQSTTNQSNSSSSNSNGSNSADSGDPNAILLDEVTIINGDYEGAMMKGVKQAVSYINGFNRLTSSKNSVLSKLNITFTDTARDKDSFFNTPNKFIDIFKAQDYTKGEKGFLNFDRRINDDGSAGVLRTQINGSIIQLSHNMGTDGIGGSANMSVNGWGAGTTVSSGSGVIFSLFSNHKAEGSSVQNSLNLQVKPGGMAAGAGLVIGARVLGPAAGIMIFAF